MYSAIIPAVVSVTRVIARPLASFLGTWLGVSYADGLVRDAFGITPSAQAVLEETAEQPDASEEQIRGTLYIAWLLKATAVLYFIYYIYCIVMKLFKR